MGKEMRRKLLTEEEKKEIKILHKQGRSERGIAKMIGCSRSAVWYHLQK